MMDGWMDECPFFVCPFFYVFFRATHLPQKARAHFSNMTGTLFEVLLGLAYFLWEKQKKPNTPTDELVKVSTVQPGEKTTM